MIFLFSFLTLRDNQGECDLDDITELYSRFYLQRISDGYEVDRANCPYNNDTLSDINYVQKSILRNPFKKFERKWFMYHSIDLKKIAFSLDLWEKIVENNDIKNIHKMKLTRY